MVNSKQIEDWEIRLENAKMFGKLLDATISKVLSEENYITLLSHYEKREKYEICDVLMKIYNQQ